jgi:hypothetical protein
MDRFRSVYSSGACAGELQLTARPVEIRISVIAATPINSRYVKNLVLKMAHPEIIIDK